MTQWKEVHDSRTEMPETLDTTSSSSIVYQRRNIRQETRTGMDEQPYTEWVYEQREMSRDEFVDVAAAQLREGDERMNNLEDAMCEHDTATDERMSALEDAVCELDSIINS